MALLAAHEAPTDGASGAGKWGGRGGGGGKGGGRYTSGKIKDSNGKSPFSMGKYIFKLGPFSVAMLD